MGRRHALPDFELLGDYKQDVEKLRGLIRNIKDGFSGDPYPHALTHRVGQEDPLPQPGAPLSVQVGGVGSIGSGPSYMREDAQLTIDTGTPVDLGEANSEGAASSVARSDHVHKRSIEVRVNDTIIGVRRKVHFLGAGVSGLDDPIEDEIEVAIAAGGAGSGVSSPDGSTESLEPAYQRSMVESYAVRAMIARTFR